MKADLNITFYKEEKFKKTPIGKIPEDWEVVRLGDVVEVHDSKRIPLSEMERSKRKGPYPYCGANGIIDYIDDYIFDGEFVLLAEDGGSYGKFENTAYIMEGKFWVNNHAHILQAVKKKAINPFILFTLNFLDLNPYIVGSTRKKLNQEQMKKIKIPLPSLLEQKAIAYILSTVDEAIQKTDEIIEKTERLKKGLMQELLTKGIGHKEFKDTEIGRIPKEWEVVRISELFNTYKGTTPSTKVKEFWNGDIPFVTPTDITKINSLNETYLETTENHITRKGLESKGLKLVPENSLLFTSRATIGYLVINRVKVAINQGIISLIPKSIEIEVAFFYYLLQKLRKLFENLAAGSTYKEISMSIFSNIKIPFPPLPEEKAIVQILSTVDEKLELERNEKTKLERIKRSLMDLLLTGKIRIKVN